MNNHYKFCEPEPIVLVFKYNLNFIEGNIIKYILRSPFKGNRIKDLRKALYYAYLLRPFGYSRDFPESEIDEYKSHLIWQEISAISLTIASDYKGYKNDNPTNVVADFLLESIKFRQEEETKNDAE